VSVDDIKAVALPALRHRVLINFEAEAEKINPDNILEEILRSVEIPKV
jgi:MoxR-like ATPase